MTNAELDIDSLREDYSIARNKYKPHRIDTLIIAEAPPCALDRFFYFEDVKKQDSLFLEIMGVLYPDLKKRYIIKKRETSLKQDMLETFKSDGYWLLHLAEVPTSISPGPSQADVDSLWLRLKKYIDKKTPVILIKTSLYDMLYDELVKNGYNVINERIPFPGSGQQGVFREKFGSALGQCS